MRVYFALNFRKSGRSEGTGTVSPPVHTLAGIPVGHQIPELAQTFLSVLLVQFHKITPVRRGERGAFGTVAEIPKLSFF
jgi:hypothetical protein